MNRCRVCIAVCLLLCFCACSADPIRPVPPALPDSFQCRARMDADRQTIECDWTLTHGATEMHILSPVELRNMTVHLSSEDAYITLDGVSAPLGDNSFFVQIAQTYTRLLQTVVEPTQTAQGWLYETQDGCAVLQDADSGLPLRISIPDAGITVALSAVAVTETESSA